MAITHHQYYFPGSEKHEARNITITRGDGVSEGVLNEFFEIFQQTPDIFLDMYPGQRKDWHSPYASKWFHLVRQDKWSFTIEMPNAHA